MFTIFQNITSRIHFRKIHLGYLMLIALILVNMQWMFRPAMVGDLTFFVDVARDFHLYREIDQKKLILIGPRSSIAGLFHGPLWLYLTYPGYVIGHGDPSVMPAYWAFLVTVFLLGSFWVARKLFGVWSGLLYVLLLSGTLIFYFSQLINPYGAFFLMPLYFYLTVLFHRTKDIRYLALHFFVGSLLFQFQIAVGIPLLALSFLYTVREVIKTRRMVLLLACLIPICGLVNFIVFDLRHDFQLTKAAVAFARPVSEGKVFDYGSLLVNRWQYFVNLQLLDTSMLFYIYSLFVVFVLLLLIHIRSDHQKDVYYLFLYYYIGYFVLSFIHKDVILFHQIVPLIPLTQLVFVSFARRRTFMITIMTGLLLWWINAQHAVTFVRYFENQYVGRDQESWVALKTMMRNYFAHESEEFGYFVYNPDSVAYHGRYAALWTFEQLGVRGHEYEKRAKTYVILAPAPKFDPDVRPDWWLENKLRLTKEPVEKTTFVNGYQIYRYELSEAEQAVQFDESLRIGTLFR